MMRSSVLGVLLLQAASAAALSPQEVLRQAQQEVLRIEILNDKAERVSAYSAISLGADRAVTLCEALDSGFSIVVLRQEKKLPARIERRDAGRNLCLLSVSGLGAPAAQLSAAGEPAAGTTVYAVSNALGLGISISDGLVAGIRTFAGETHIQFTAPIAVGSEGGGLYDASGRVVGLIDYQQRDGQNVNFAMPAAWIGEIEQRADATAATDAWRSKASALRRDSQAEALERLTREWTAAQPQRAEAWLWLGHAASQLADRTTAERAYREALKLEPASLPAGLGLSRALLLQGQGPAALETARGLLALRRENVDVWNAIGWAELLVARLDAARQAFEQAVRLDPWSTESYLGLARLARARNDAPATTSALRRLTQIEPDNRIRRIDLAEAYYIEKRYGRALASAQSVLDSAPEDSDALLWKGGALKGLGRTREAIEALVRGLAGKPVKPAYGWNWLGTAYYELKLYPEAIAAYRAGLPYEPQGESYLRANLGLALKDGRHFDQALALFEKLREERPGDAFAWRQIGYVQTMMGKPEAAIPALERSLNLDPSQGKTWHALIEAYDLVGRRDDARRAYDKLRGIDPQRAEEAYRSVIVVYEDSR